jgi:hypothetical protein
MAFPHPGIRIHDIPAEGVGGGIFALGTAAIVLMQYPALLPVAVAAVAGGALLAPVLHRLHLHRL